MHERTCIEKYRKIQLNYNWWDFKIRGVMTINTISIDM